MPTDDESCPVCTGSGLLLRDPCPLCCDSPLADSSDGDPRDGEEGSAGAVHAAREVPEEEMWCDVCGVKCQSASSWADHLSGRKHLRRLGNHISARASLQPQLSEEALFAGLAAGKFQQVVICTGAGVSTEAGIPDFRSTGGLFESLCKAWGERFPAVHTHPEHLLSRSFADMYPEAWSEEVLPWLRNMKWESAKPSAVHWFCSWLHHQGWLRRVYTQNVDGLHTRPELRLPADLVVECHGNMRDGTVVLYGDSLPARFDECCRSDFPCPSLQEPIVDLMLVFGTSLQVAPFCALPNMVPRGCPRVLVNRNLSDCMTNDFSRPKSSHFVASSALRIGTWKKASLRSLWREKEGHRRWPQLLVEAECAEFIDRFFSSQEARARGLEHPG